MSARPFFNTSTEELERLFHTATFRQDLVAVNALADELNFRDKPRATQLKLKINEFLKAHLKPHTRAPLPNELVAGAA